MSYGGGNRGNLSVVRVFKQISLDLATEVDRIPKRLVSSPRSRCQTDGVFEKQPPA